MKNSFGSCFINLFKGSGLNTGALNSDIKAYNQNRSKEDRDCFCNAPFKSLYFSHNGQVTPCCFNRRYVLGDITHQRIENIWNGIQSKTLRNALKKNDLSLGCYICELNLRSKNYKSVEALRFDGLSPKEKMPFLFEFEADNTCNLECIMCTGEFSSAIRKNREHKTLLDNIYDDSFILQLQPFLKNLKEARFNGGEPFLSPLYHKIWNEIIRVNPTCRISVQTNATILNDTVKDFLNRGNFHISVSLDALDKDLYEKIRVNAHYEKVIENLIFFRDYCLKKGNYFGVTVCPIRLNWKEMPLLLSFANKNKANIHFHTVLFPPSLALWNHSYNELKNIYQYLDRFNWAAQNETEGNNIKLYRQLITQIEQWGNAAKERESDDSVLKRDTNLLTILLGKIYLWCDNNISNIDERQNKKEKFRIIIEDITGKFENDVLTNCMKEILKTPVEFIVLTLELDDKSEIMERFKAFIL